MKAQDLKLYDWIKIPKFDTEYWIVDIICGVFILARDDRFKNCNTIPLTMDHLDTLGFNLLGHVKLPMFHKYADYIPFELKVKYIRKDQETIDLIEEWIEGR